MDEDIEWTVKTSVDCEWCGAREIFKASSFGFTGCIFCEHCGKPTTVIHDEGQRPIIFRDEDSKIMELMRFIDESFKRANYVVRKKKARGNNINLYSH